MPEDERDDTEPTESTASAPESFDAVEAAAELAAALGRQGEADPDADTNPNPTNYTAILEDEVEALQAALAEKEQALEAAQAKAAEARGEVEKARVRLERDAAGTIERKRRDVISSFLDVADDLGRAAAELSQHGIEASIAQGVHMVVSKLQGVLRQHGAEHRPALGQPFDSAVHEAIGTVPATDEAPDGVVVAVVQEGYVIGEQVLRAARVVVAKG